MPWLQYTSFCSYIVCVPSRKSPVQRSPSREIRIKKYISGPECMIFWTFGNSASITTARPMFLDNSRGDSIELVVPHRQRPTPPRSRSKWLAKCEWNSGLESDLVGSAESPYVIGRAGLPLPTGPGLDFIRPPQHVINWNFGRRSMLDLSPALIGRLATYNQR